MISSADAPLDNPEHFVIVTFGHVKISFCRNGRGRAGLSWPGPIWFRQAHVQDALVVVEILEVGINDIVVAGPGLICRHRLVFAFFLRCLVDGFAQFHGRFCHVLDARLDLVGIVGFQLVLERGDGQFDRFDRGRVDLVGPCSSIDFLGRVDEAFRLVLGFDQLATFLVGLGVLLGVLEPCFSMSSSLRPPEAWIVIFCSLPVPLSLA